ncbi:hypothetical protein EF847_01585 [Actinobacteria bacterium YIM 96077]|uniref:Large polyvalent protein associated domain-containing protein n=1 Tax=Phytoactinopolyspora halophila TaxID=1981511 RepID=A0A329QKW2_9ACTN|nr:hypothetical protein EF847_01585 [Actinobacteria bacterium YIM 96077]RAW11158.1 hypothetical protein DPM12_17610 [Phytoactinopolyspora halophila]
MGTSTIPSPQEHDQVVNSMTTMVDVQDRAEIARQNLMQIHQTITEAGRQIGENKGWEAPSWLGPLQGAATWTGRAFGKTADAVGTGISGGWKGLQAGSRWLGERILGEDANSALNNAVDSAYDTMGDAGTAFWDGYTHTAEIIDRSLSTAVLSGTVADERGWDPLARFSPENIGEAWELSENVTAGQALVDPIWLEDDLFSNATDETLEAYREGFDEMGRPLDAAYQEVRDESALYNISSGALDFIKAFYFDPAVIAGKGISVARGVYRGDLANMTRRQERRMTEIVTASPRRLERMHVRRTDIAGQRALALRERINNLADEVRAGSLDETDLIRREQAFAMRPDSAAVFAEAARAKRIDTRTGEFLNEHDDELFRAFLGVSLGDQRSIDKLMSRGRRGQELVEDVARMGTTRNNTLAEVARASEEEALRIGDEISNLVTNSGGRQFRDVRVNRNRGRLNVVGDGEKSFDLVGQRVVWDTTPQGVTSEATRQLRDTIQARALTARESAEWATDLRTRLERFTGYHMWLDDVTQKAAESPLRLVPGAGRSAPNRLLDRRSEARIGLMTDPAQSDVRTSIFRPNKANNVGASIMKPAPGWIRRRPGVLDLHRPDEGFKSVERYFDQMRVYAGVGAIQSHMGVERFEALQRSMSNRMLRANNDVERRRVAEEIDAVGVELVATKHGLTPQQALIIARDLQNRKQQLWGDIERRYVETRGRDADPDAPIGQIEVSDGSDLVMMDMPLSVTQLKNHHFGTDLRALDSLLQRHSGGIRNLLGEGGDAATRALEYFHMYWKPSVLFRLGYPIRNISDDGVRALSMAEQPFTMIGNMGIGAAQLMARAGKRVANYGRVPLNVYDRKRWQGRNQDVVKGVDPSAARVDDVRMRSIDERTEGVDAYERTLLHAQANGRARGKVRKPSIVGSIERWLKDDDTFAFDAARSKKVNANNVHDFGLSDAVTMSSRPTAAQIARFAREHSDRLSHQDGAVLVQKTSDGWRMTVGRQGAKWKPIDQVTPRAMTNRVSIWTRQDEEVEFGAPGEPGAGDMFVPLSSSSEDAWKPLAFGGELNAAQVRGEIMRGRRTQTADGRGHAELASEIINREILPDPIIRRYLDSETTDDFVKWLRSPEGRRQGRRVPHKAANPQKWTDEIEQMLNDLLPDEALRQKVRAGQKIDSDEIWLRMQDNPSSVPGYLDERAIQTVFGKGPQAGLVTRLVNKIYDALAVMPTDMVARQPFFRDQYKARLRRIVDSADEGRPSGEVMEFAERQAREYALGQVRRYLFSLADSTDLNHMFRFVSPFMAAWQETMARWATIAMERPHNAFRVWGQGWQSFDELFFLEFVDDEGRNKDDPDHGDLNNIIIPMPDGVKDVAGLLPGIDRESLQYLDGVNVNKNSLNAIMQGNMPWMVPAGPLVQFPVSELYKEKPWLVDENAFSEFTHKWLMPVGPTDIYDMIMPAGWQQSVHRWMAGVEDPVFQSFAANYHRARIHEWRSNGQVGPEPSESQSTQMAQQLQLFHAMGRFASPGSFTLETGVPSMNESASFFIQAARRIRDENPNASEGELLTLFAEEYGEDAWVWWSGTSENGTGLPATSDAVKAYEANKDVIEDNPDLALLFTGMDVFNGDYTYESYLHQQDSGHRERMSGQEVIAESERAQGWAEYNQFDQAIKQELVARGITDVNVSGEEVAGSIQRTGAEDLQLAKQRFVSHLKQKYPGWEEDYSAFDTGKGYRTVNQVRQLIDEGRAPNPEYRPDWAGITEYLQLHDAFAAELDARSMMGGSRNIEAQENRDLAVAWEAAIADLTSRNLEFADVYSRFFERHKLTMGSG